MTEPEWTEGVLGDGAAILRDGVQIPISELLHILNSADSAAERARLQAFEEAAKIVYGLSSSDNEAERIASAIRQHAKGDGKS